MELKEQFFIAKRVKKVIESCDTIEQLEVAKNYLNLFFRLFSEPYKMDSRFETVTADQSTIKLYNNLLDVWEDKRSKFSDIDIW